MHTTRHPPNPAAPPGPPPRWGGLPLLNAMRRDMMGVVQQLHREYGDLVYSRIWNEDNYDLFHPDLVREAMVTHAADLVRWERGVEIFSQLFGSSVLTTDGAVWQRQRAMLRPAFTPKRVAGYAGLMAAAATPVLDQALPPGQPQALVDMDALCTGMTMEVILRTLFGQGAANDGAEAMRALQVILASAQAQFFWPRTLPDWLPLPGKAAKRRALRSMRGLVARHIQACDAELQEAQRQGQSTPPHLLAMLRSLRDESGEALSDQEVFDQCMVSFQAGHETTATALLWWSRLMAEHPQALLRAQAEVDAVLQGRQPQPDDMPQLSWLGATLKEAMRLYPPVPMLMTRRTLRDMELGGWHIPAGALLRVMPYVLHHDPRWHVRPDDFWPERYADAAEESQHSQRDATMPFGIGPQVCLGQHFAWLEMQLLAAMLLQRYELELPATAPPRRARFHITLRPADGVVLMLRRRAGHTAS